MNHIAMPISYSFQRWLDRLQDACANTGRHASPTARMNEMAISEYRLARLDALQIDDYRQLHRIDSAEVPLGYFALLARNAQFQALHDACMVRWPQRTQVLENKLLRAHRLVPSLPVRVHTLLTFHFKESDGHASFALTTSFVQQARSAVINKTTFRYGTLGVHGDTLAFEPFEPGESTLLGVWRPRGETSMRVRTIAQERNAIYPPAVGPVSRRTPEREIDIGHSIGKTCAIAETRLGQPLCHATHWFHHAILEADDHAIHLAPGTGELSVRSEQGLCLRMVAR